MAFVAHAPLAAAHADPITLTTLVEHTASRVPDRPALLGPGQRDTETFAELVARSRRVAAGLAALGIVRGDVVAAQLPNGREFVALYLAAARLGAALQTLHMPYRGAELLHLLGSSGATVAVAPARLKGESPAALILGLRAHLPRLVQVVAVGEEPPNGSLPWSALTGEDGPLEDRARADDAMLLLYTSGTTASPKGVANAHRGFMANARASAAEFGLTSEDVVLAAAPYTHLYGAFALHLGLASGAASALLPAFSPVGLVEAVRGSGATAIFAAPAHFAAMLAGDLVRADEFGSVRLICVSGSAVAPELAAAIEAAIPTARVVQLWGMSELQAGSYGRPGDPLAIRHCTAGRPSPGTELRIVDDEDAPGEPGLEGRLQVRGASLFSEYRGNPAATAAAFTPDNWFDTGDTGRLTPEGALVLTGRVKEIINRGGVKFSPVDVEAAIERMPGVARAAIVPMPDPVLGERAALFVTRVGGQAVTLDAVTAHLRALGIAKYKWPERLELLDDMPMTPTQKIMRGRLADLLQGRGDTP